MRKTRVMPVLVGFATALTAQSTPPRQATPAIANGAVISLVMPHKNGVTVAQGSGKKEPALTARDYYKELYAAGGLDRMADAYACFEDDPSNKAFFIFGQSKDIREFIGVVPLGETSS